MQRYSHIHAMKTPDNKGIEKQFYEAPETQALELMQEGVVCQSSGLWDYKRQNPIDW